jgi:hypothetical protein
MWPRPIAARRGCRSKARGVVLPGAKKQIGAPNGDRTNHWPHPRHSSLVTRPAHRPNPPCDRIPPFHSIPEHKRSRVRASNQPSPLSTSHSSRRSGHPGRYTPPSPTPPNSGWVVALRLTPVPRYWFAGVPFTCSLVLLPESERAAGSDPDRAQTRLARLLTIFPGRFCLESAELSWPFHSPHCVRSGPSRLKIGHTVRSWSATKG